MTLTTTDSSTTYEAPSGFGCGDAQPTSFTRFQVNNILDVLNEVQTGNELVQTAHSIGIELSTEVARNVVAARVTRGAFISLDEVTGLLDRSTLTQLLHAARHCLVVPRAPFPLHLDTSLAVTGLARNPSLLLPVIPPPILATLPTFTDLFFQKQGRLGTQIIALDKRIADIRAQRAGTTDADQLQRIDEAIDAVSQQRNAIVRELDRLNVPSNPRETFGLILTNYREQIAALRREAVALAGLGRPGEALVREAEARGLEDRLTQADRELTAQGF